ncbi:MAG: hypothetical protein ABI947_06405 [Chloroflexota bacterium]
MSTSTTPPTVSAWDKRSSQTVEQIYPGVTRIWLHKGQIVCYTVTSVTRAAADAWLNSAVELVAQWPADQPYLSIHDFSEATLTPFIRKRSVEANKAMPPTLFGRSAVIMPRTFVNHIIRLFVTTDLSHANKRIQRDVFFRLEEATEWLLKGMDKKPAPLPKYPLTR